MSKAKTDSKKNLNTKKKNTKGLVVLILAIVIALIVSVSSFFLYKYLNPSSGLEDTQWKSVSAYDDANKEVDIQTVYDTYYSTYQGSMSFKSDGTFSFWMTPGNAEDGTHSGIYTYDSEKDSIKVKFDSGDEAKFDIVRNNEENIERIEVPYRDYIIHFELA